MTNKKITLQPGENHIELEKIIIDAECDQDGKPIWYKETKKKNGDVKYREYDENGNEVYYTWSNGDKLYEEIHNVYNDNNKIISKTDKRGNHTTYEYDEQGREIHYATVNKDGKLIAQLFTEYDERGLAKKYLSAPDSKVRGAINTAVNVGNTASEFVDDVYKETENLGGESKFKIPWWGKLIIVLIIICNPITSLVLFGVLLKAFPYIVMIVMVAMIIKVIIKRVKNKNKSTDNTSVDK